jgi:SpoVK/Ycf46/Vps4 family AAA+-type ATPase
MHQQQESKTMHEQNHFSVFIDHRPPVTFQDVGGMDKLKHLARMKIITPFQKPELFRKYGKKAGGGILLYGPPGCGKTFFARAIAGECGTAFFNVGIHDILDMYVGNSEKTVHRLFDDARKAAPAVVFIDEMDALGRKRELLRHTPMTTVINTFLNEMDGVAGCNDNLLIIGATNAPWDIDSAFKRPGRFDTMILVEPPDRQAREEMLRIMLSGRPIKDVDYGLLAQKTELFSGADLAGLVERATDIVLEEALSTGNERSITTADLLQALKREKSSITPWLEVARNYVEFANAGGQYDAVQQLLQKSGTGKRNKVGFF